MKAPEKSVIPENNTSANGGRTDPETPLRRPKSAHKELFGTWSRSKPQNSRITFRFYHSPSLLTIPN